MFTGRRRQGSAQEEEVPEPGVDSTYGVRSLGDSDFGSASASVASLTTGLPGVEAASVEIVQVDPESTPTPNVGTLIDVGIDVDTEAEVEASPVSPVITSPRSPTALPPHDNQVDGYYRHTLLDDLSEPSSPASFASMPSYISSSSRTSSLGPDMGRIPYPYNYGGSEELVMPTMNFAQPHARDQPQGSSTGDERGRGVQVFLLGDEKQVDGFKEELRGHEGVLELGAGRWTIGGGEAVTISSGPMEEIETRLDNAYITLNGALHPDPSPALRAEVQDLVSSYGLKSDWVHLVVVLDDRDTASLGDMVPIICPEIPPPQTSSPVERASSPLASPHAIPDPTPRPGVEGLSYFQSQSTGSDSSLISHLINKLQSPGQLQSASTAKFLSWRQSRRDLSSHHTSTSHSHESSSCEAAPMPTIARAQGGGEWEANLSRRLANRRQSFLSPDEPKRGRRRSTASRSKASKGIGKESCGPLFPFPSSSGSSDPSGVGLGISELVEKTFGELRRRWKWGLVAAAVALVVGWNWNMGSGAGVRLSTCI